jgi:sarcosine oxidase subunit delta
MLLIPCPHCGARDESEFDYGGRAIAFPALDATLQAWHQAVHLGCDGERTAEEYWYHAAGCERWIQVTRDLLSHEITTALDAAAEVVE